MTNAYTLRNHFELREYNTAIDRETFEHRLFGEEYGRFLP